MVVLTGPTIATGDPLPAGSALRDFRPFRFHRDSVALGRRGGQKGGKARAEKLTEAQIREISSAAGIARMEGLGEKERIELARKAAAARWAGHEAKRPPKAPKGKK